MSNLSNKFLQKRKGGYWHIYLAIRTKIRTSDGPWEGDRAGWTTGTQFESWSGSTPPIFQVVLFGTIDFYMEPESLVSSSVLLTIYAIVKEWIYRYTVQWCIKRYSTSIGFYNITKATSLLEDVTAKHHVQLYYSSRWRVACWVKKVICKRWLLWLFMSHTLPPKQVTLLFYCALSLFVFGCCCCRCMNEYVLSLSLATGSTRSRKRLFWMKQ